MHSNDAAGEDGPNGKNRWGAIIGNAPITQFQLLPGAEKHGIEAHDLTLLPYKNSAIPETADFTTPALPAQLGFPIKIASDPTSKTSEPNWHVHMLFVNADATSPSFSRADDSDPPGGDVMVVRTDGKEMDYLQYNALHMFIVTNMIIHCKPLDMTPEGDEKQKIKQQVANRLTPSAFHTFFEEYRRHNVQLGQEAFKATKSPVLVTFETVEPACGKCNLKGKPESPLLRCAKCKNRHYCGPQCQKKDWKFHKLVCGMD